MSKNIYGGDIAPKCEYCEKGRQIEGDNAVLCRYKGIMRSDSHCGKFKYSPLKRKPETIKIQADFSIEDFEI